MSRLNTWPIGMQLTSSSDLWSEKPSDTNSSEIPNEPISGHGTDYGDLCEGGRIKKGSQRYKIARKMIAIKIDRMGPDAAYTKAKWNKHELLVQIDELHRLSGLGRS
jgi:hypothetical protein